MSPALVGEVLPPAESSGPLATRHGGHLVEINVSAPWRTVFDMACRGKDRSPHTIRVYLRHLEAFFDWSGLVSPTQITPGVLAMWRAELVERYPEGKASRSQAMAALRSLLKFCRAFPAGHHLPSLDLLREIFELPKVATENPYQLLSETDQEQLLDTATATGWTLQDSTGRVRRWKRSAEIRTRDYALLMVMLGSGLRVAEVTGLDIRDLYETSDGLLRLHVRSGKGDKPRTVGAPDDTTAAVLEYLETTRRRLGAKGPLFVATQGAARRMSPRAVWAVVDRLMTRAGIQGKKISPHSLRHTFAVKFLQAGGDVVTLQGHMGHSQLQTTQRYVKHLQSEAQALAMPSVRKGAAKGPRLATQ